MCKASPAEVKLFLYLSTFFLPCYNKFERLLATLLKTLYGTKTNRAFSHDVTPAILVFQNDKTMAMFGVPDQSVEFFSYVNPCCSRKFARVLATRIKILYS